MLPVAALLVPYLACHQVDSESCSNDAVNGPVSAVKEALDAAEKSAYDMLKLFSEGLRDDIHDVSTVTPFLLILGIIFMFTTKRNKISS